MMHVSFTITSWDVAGLMASMIGYWLALFSDSTAGCLVGWCIIGALFVVGR